MLPHTRLQPAEVSVALRHLPHLAGVGDRNRIPIKQVLKRQRRSAAALIPNGVTLTRRIVSLDRRSVNQMGEGRSPAGCIKLPRIDALVGAKKRRPAIKKISMVQTFKSEIFKELVVA
jgi:hypothetical protein